MKIIGRDNKVICELYIPKYCSGIKMLDTGVIDILGREYYIFIYNLNGESERLMCCLVDTETGIRYHSSNDSFVSLMSKKYMDEIGTGMSIFDYHEGVMYYAKFVDDGSNNAFGEGGGPFKRKIGIVKKDGKFKMCPDYPFNYSIYGDGGNYNYAIVQNDDTGEYSIIDRKDGENIIGGKSYIRIDCLVFPGVGLDSPRMTSGLFNIEESYDGISFIYDADRRKRVMDDCVLRSITPRIGTTGEYAIMFYTNDESLYIYMRDGSWWKSVDACLEVYMSTTKTSFVKKNDMDNVVVKNGVICGGKSGLTKNFKKIEM